MKYTLKTEVKDSPIKDQVIETGILTYEQDGKIVTDKLTMGNNLWPVKFQGTKLAVAISGTGLRSDKVIQADLGYSNHWIETWKFIGDSSPDLEVKAHLTIRKATPTILQEYEDSGYKLFYDMFGVLDGNEPYKCVRGD